MIGQSLIGAGVPVKLLKHDSKAYKVIGVPKSAVPEPILRIKEVVMAIGVPQLNTTITIEARVWVEKRRFVYFITRKPYSDYLTRLAEQGVREVLLYQIVPSYQSTTREGRA